MKPMTIDECCALAQEKGYDSMEFTMVTNTGFWKCRWLDAYMGLFTIPDDEELSKGFITVSKVRDGVLFCTVEETCHT